MPTLGLEAPDLVLLRGLASCRVDRLSGVPIAEAWTRHVIAPFEDVAVPFLSRADLVRNKRATGRTRDLAALEALGEP